MKEQINYNVEGTPKKKSLIENLLDSIFTMITWAAFCIVLFYIFFNVIGITSVEASLFFGIVTGVCAFITDSLLGDIDA